jgi:hypothetical protein
MQTTLLTVHLQKLACAKLLSLKMQSILVSNLISWLCIQQGVVRYNSENFSSYELPLVLFDPPRLTLKSAARTNNGQPVQIVVFKTARSGSTWFHSELAGALTHHKLHEVGTWEPFGHPSCYHSSSEASKAFDLILDPSVECAPVHKKDKCTPTMHCWRINNPKSRVNVVSFNPRFVDTLPFEEMFKHAAVVNLRRTNLVRQAYSKHHHGGVSSADPECGDSTQFTLQVLLCGVWHYAIGDQEFASASAVRASATAYILLYEDLIAYEALSKHLLFALNLHLGDNASAIHAPKKKHTATHMCTYTDVQCDASGLAGLTQRKFPCLYKQFHEDPKNTWSMPMLRDGTISVFGDCIVLPPLEHPRQLASLYHYK